jgi:hypothetical protein
MSGVWFRRNSIVISLPRLWSKFRYWWKYHNYKIVPRYIHCGYQDKVEVLPHMIFEILSLFIEEECSPGYVEWYGKYGHKIKGKFVRDEMQELYDWWNKDYNKKRDTLKSKIWAKIYKYSPKTEFISIKDNPGLTTMKRTFKNSWYKKQSKKHWDELHKMERQYELDLNKNCKRVIDLIPYLWT